MKPYRIILTVALLAACIVARAQHISRYDYLSGSLSTIKASVLDSLTNEPIPFASVYLIPSKDTTITNFTITNDKGEATLDEVPYGSYVFHVEMLGYKPFVKEKYFRQRMEKIGTIRLTIDEQFLSAATVSAVGNPIIIKQDTVEFNASSFRVGSNAMLRDLILRMPGMEITEDGKVKFNGEAINQLTVGGRTFFFSDQSTALNNLPASIVDKIRVIDRDSRRTRATGIQDGSREKVLDVSLKKEYEKGWFGNVALRGGSTIGGKDDDNPLRDNRGFLWSGNALASAYNENDQLTVVANGQNVNDTNGVLFVLRSSGAQAADMSPGLSSAGQFGVNLNTQRIKDVEATLGVNYKYVDTDAGSSTARTTYMDDGDLNSVNESTSKSYAHGVTAEVEMRREKGNVWFEIEPVFRYSKTDLYSSGYSDSQRGDVFVNHSESNSHNRDESSEAAINTSATFRELWGKAGRSLRLILTGNYTKSSDSSEENTILETAVQTSPKNLTYVGDGNSSSLSGHLQYTEPLGDKWVLSASLNMNYQHSEKVRDASDASGHNDYYSSESRNNSLGQMYDVTVQYKFGKRSWITFGATLSGVLNETFSRNYGITEETGKGKWLWYVTPTFRLRHKVNNDLYGCSVLGNSNMPSVSNMLPVLNISNPSRLSLGNIYLLPGSVTIFNGSWSRNNRERFSTAQAGLSGSVSVNPVTRAIWYDKNGITYSIPVNSRKPTVSARIYGSYTTPLDKDKLWSLTLTAMSGLSSRTGYQARNTLAALDKDSFVYSDFMADFWGDEKGNRFYGGQSGFSESNTLSLTPYASVAVKYNQEHYSVNAGANVMGSISRYSLNPDINMNTADYSIFASGSYTTKHEFEFNTDISYNFHSGYADGYGKPEWRWNAEVSKNIGAFNLSIKAYDILNQARSLTRTITANYAEDSYRLIMGRYIMFGVKWNFGKMNAAQSRRAERAALRTY